MNVRVRLLVGFVFCFVSTTVFADEGENPILTMTQRYRNAVLEFEEIVDRTRGVRSSDERLVEKLEDATRRLLVTAKNPRHLNKLKYQWKLVAGLERRVQSAIFQKYTPTHDLVSAWERVLYSAWRFESEFVFETENPMHSDKVTRRTNSNRNQNLIDPIVNARSEATLPSIDLR